MASHTLRANGITVELELTPHYWRKLTRNLAAAQDSVHTGDRRLDEPSILFHQRAKEWEGRVLGLFAKVMACTLRHFRVCKKLDTNASSLVVSVFVPADTTITVLLERAAKCTAELNTLEHDFLEEHH